MNETEILRRILQYISFYTLVPRETYNKLAHVIARDLLTSHNLRIYTQKVQTSFFLNYN